MTGGIVARRREFRGLRPGLREWQAKSAGGRLPLRDFYEQKKRSPPPGGLLFFLLEEIPQRQPAAGRLRLPFAATRSQPPELAPPGDDAARPARIRHGRQAPLADGGER